MRGSTLVGFIFAVVFVQASQDFCVKTSALKHHPRLLYGSNLRTIRHEPHSLMPLQDLIAWALVSEVLYISAAV